MRGDLGLTQGSSFFGARLIMTAMRDLSREPSLFSRARGKRIEYRELRGALFVDRASGRPARTREERLEAVRRTEIRQGALGNCAFLSAVGALARLIPERLVDLFADEAEDRCSVTLFEDSAHARLPLVGRVPLVRELRFGRPRPVRLTMHYRFPVWRERGSPSFVAPFSRPGLCELWLMVLEKAYAQLQGSYLLAQVGLGAHALGTLTGAPVRLHEPGVLGLERLGALVDARHAILATTLPNVLAGGRFALPRDHVAKLFPVHVYQVQHVEPARERIQLINPHGPDRSVTISYEELCRYFLSVVSARVS
jgi:hypothetical protein